MRCTLLFVLVLLVGCDHRLFVQVDDQADPNCPSPSVVEYRVTVAIDGLPPPLAKAQFFSCAEVGVSPNVLLHLPYATNSASLLTVHVEALNNDGLVLCEGTVDQSPRSGYTFTDITIPLSPPGRPVDANLRGVYQDGGQVYAVGYNTILHHDGMRWQQESWRGPCGPAPTFKAVGGTESCVWAVGNDSNDGEVIVVREPQSGTWQCLNSGGSSSLDAIAGSFVVANPSAGMDKPILITLSCPGSTPQQKPLSENLLLRAIRTDGTSVYAVDQQSKVYSIDPATGQLESPVGIKGVSMMPIGRSLWNVPGRPNAFWVAGVFNNGGLLRLSQDPVFSWPPFGINSGGLVSIDGITTSASDGALTDLTEEIWACGPNNTVVYGSRRNTSEPTVMQIHVPSPPPPTPTPGWTAVSVTRDHVVIVGGSGGIARFRPPPWN